MFAGAVLILCPHVVVLKWRVSGRTAGSVILKISHGYNVKDDGDPLVEMANRAMQNLSVVATPGRFLVDVIPICTFLHSVRFISAA